MCSVWCQHPQLRDTTVLVATPATWSDQRVRTAIHLARAQLRRGWRGLIGLSLLIALVAAMVLAGFAGAQRTRTAVDRMIEATAAADVLINPDRGDESALDFEQVAALPMVAAYSRVHGVSLFAPGPYEAVEDLFNGPMVASADGSLLREFDRPVLADGNVPDAGSLDEIYLDRTYAESAGLTVGDTIEFRLLPVEVLEEVFESDDVEAGLAIVSDPGVGSTLELTVAGVGSNVDGIAVDEGYEPVAGWIGPALYESLGEPTAGFGGAVARLTDPDRVGEFKAAVDAMVPDELIVYQTLDVTKAKALRATQPAAAALAIFAAITALLGLLVVGQAISRRFQLDARDNMTLTALGTTTRERFFASTLRLALATLCGVGLGIALAAALSRFTPAGPAEFAEPQPGFALDGAILTGGGAVLLVAVMAVGLIPAWHGARRLDPHAGVRGSSVAGWLAARGASPQLTTGVRFGLEPGRGPTAVPTRATIVGAMTAIAIAVATIVFASSLDRVVNDGRFYGSNFDLALDFDGVVGADTELGQPVMSIVADDDAAARIGEMTITEIFVNDRPVTSLAFASFGDAAQVDPTIAEGREPVGPGEVAIGLTTMHDLGVDIGDAVSMRVDGVESQAEVVGRAVLPGVGLYQGSDRTSIGVGAVIAPELLGPRDEATKSFVVVELAPGADRAAFEQRMNERLSDYGALIIQDDGRPSDIDGLARLRSLPVVLAAVLVVLVACTVIHAMVIAVRRRRRDVAILQALGSTRGKVTAIGVWQGVTIGVAGLLVGVPFGIVAGRWLWTWLANQFGTLAQPVVPLGGVVVLVVAVLTLAALAGLVPIRRGLRHRPAEVLRSE